MDKQRNKWKALKTQKEITEQHGRRTEKEKGNKEHHTQILHKKAAGADKSEGAETMEEGGRTGHCLRSRTHTHAATNKSRGTRKRATPKATE